MAAKTKEQQIGEARSRLDKLLVKKEQLMGQIRREEDVVKRLESQQREEQVKAVVKRVEISGFDLEDILNELEKRARKAE